MAIDVQIEPLVRAAALIDEQLHRLAPNDDSVACKAEGILEAAQQALWSAIDLLAAPRSMSPEMSRDFARLSRKFWGAR